MSATVSIGSGFDTADALSFTANPATMGDIAGSYDPVAGVLTMTSVTHATLSQWQTALRAVKFQSSSTSYGNRTIGFQAYDGMTTGVVATKTVALLDPDPYVTIASGSAAFTGGDNGPAGLVAIDNNLTVTDPRGLALTGAVVQITGNYRSAQDVVGFTNNNASSYGNIAATFDSTTGTLTMTSASNTASVTQWRNALRAPSTSRTPRSAPDTSLRTVTMTVTDALYPGIPVSRTVTVTARTRRRSSRRRERP